MAFSRWIRVGSGLAGLLLLVWAGFGAVGRGVDGRLTSAVCVPIALAVGAWAIAAAADSPFRKSALWFALAIGGQAATLQMIQAGPLLRYQHYPPLATIAREHPWLLTWSVAQAVIIVVGMGRWAYAERRALRSRPIVRIGIALLLSVVTAATVSPSVSRYLLELSLAAFLQSLAIATVVLMMKAVPAHAALQTGRWVSGLLASDEQTANARQGRDRFGWIAAVVSLVLAAALNLLSYERYPHVPDEVVYLYHARYFADARLTMPPPPVPVAFDLDLMSLEPSRWFSPVPPGWPAVLSLGVLARAPWLVNPALAALCVLLTYSLLSHLYPRRVAQWATALLAVSPWFLFLAMSFMTHMITLTCALIAATGIVRARSSGRFAWGLIAGAGVGGTSLVRPLDGLIIGLLIAAWAIGIGGQRLKLVALAGLLFGTVATGALAFPYNQMLTGNPLIFPINAYADKRYGPNSNSYGFGPDRGLGWAIDPNPGHGPVDGLINANLNAFGINTDLFGWSTGSLILIAGLLCLGRLGRADYLMIATGAVIFVAYFFYYFSGGPDYAARYWFPIIVPLVALSARGLSTIEQRIGPRAGLAAGALIAMSLVTYIPWRAMDKYHHFRGMRADMRTLAAQHRFGPDLVLVRGLLFPDYTSAAVENPLDLRTAATVYAWDRDPAVRADVLRAYSDRQVWLVDGPSITGNGYLVTGGPISAMALARGGSK